MLLVSRCQLELCFDGRECRTSKRDVLRPPSSKAAILGTERVLLVSHRQLGLDLIEESVVPYDAMYRACFRQ